MLKGKFFPAGELHQYDSTGLKDQAAFHFPNLAALQEIEQEFTRREQKRGRLTQLGEMCRQQVLSLIEAARTLTRQPNAKQPAGTTQPLCRLYPWQQQALTAWKNAGKRGIVEAVTGAGKTILGIEAIREQLAGGDKAVVIVPTTELLDQWADRLRQELPGRSIGLRGDGHIEHSNLCDVLVATVHQGARYDLAPSTRAPLLIADEVHRFAAKTYQRALRPNFTKRLGLSATWQRADGKEEEYLRPYFGDIIYSLDYQNARSERVISPFRVALVRVDFDNDERDKFEAASTRFSNAHQKLARTLGIDIGLIDLEKISVIAKGGYGKATLYARIFLSALAEIQKILTETRSKISLAAALADAVAASDGAIAFTMTVAAAGKLANAWQRSGIRSAVIHSGLASFERKETMERFHSRQVKVIVAPKVLDEGVDVPDADLALIVATSKSRIQLIQRIGRVLRLKQHGREARIALLYVHGTREDPNRGVHDAALEDIRMAATAVQQFDGEADLDNLIEFLSP